MTDREIIEKLTEFMGWQFTDKALVIGEHLITNAATTVWYWHENGGIGVAGATTLRDFNPLTDPAACALVKAELRRRGYFFEYEYMPHKGKVHYCGIYEVDKDVGPRVGVSYADTEERAVCLAVLKAIENGRPEPLSSE